MNNITPRKEDFSEGVTTDVEQDVIQRFFSDDSETTYKIGDRVKKATYDTGDIHEKGTRGVVTGAMMDVEMEYYLVDFRDGDGNIAMTLKYKIELDD